MARWVSFSTFGNELYSGKRSYNFVGRRKLWLSIAAALTIISILIPVVKGGFNLGIDFRGGSEFTVSNAKNTDTSIGEKTVSETSPGHNVRVTKLAGDTIQVQTDRLDDSQTLEVKKALQNAYETSENDVTSTFVGPTWGADVTRQALVGLIVFVLLATILMALYFRTWKMSISAILAMLFVQIVTAGLYSLSEAEVTPSAIIGFLTILSYSLYDIVVVFDKIRENTASVSTSTRRTFHEEVNLAVNQTLVRSINTSIVAILPVAAILFIGSFLLGAGTLRDLSLSLFIGILVGALTTLFVAAPLYALLRLNEPALREQAQKVRDRRKSEALASTS